MFGGIYFSGAYFGGQDFLVVGVTARPIFLDQNPEAIYLS